MSVGPLYESKCIELSSYNKEDSLLRTSALTEVMSLNENLSNKYVHFKGLYIVLHFIY